MSALDPGRQLLSPVLHALSAAEDEGRISRRVAENRRRWATEHADADGVVAVPRGWSAMDSPGTYSGDETTPLVARHVGADRAVGGRGAVLRFAGPAVAVVGVVSALWTSVRADPLSAGEAAREVLLAGVIEAVFYGGLLWAAGVVVGQLDALLREG